MSSNIMTIKEKMAYRICPHITVDINFDPKSPYNEWEQKFISERKELGLLTAWINLFKRLWNRR